MREIKAVITFKGERADYFVSELDKYLKKISRGELFLCCEYSDKLQNGVLNLGLLEDLGLDASDLEDPFIEDIVDIDVKDCVGYIAGSNERSVLMGIYKFFKSAGCRWVRPGEKGEYIPHCDLTKHSFKYRKKAEYNFRGQCIEGAVGFEHVRDTVTWLPKADMNMFMIEQIVPYNYMNRWYRHLVNTKLSHEDIPYEKYCEYCLELEQTIKKCGLQFHAMGHGALNEPFGVRHMVSGQDYAISEEAKNAFALVKGERGLYKKSPFFTQLCMSKAWVREKVVNWLLEYIKEKPHIDFLHFWLADSTNNHCECEDCVKKTPSDWYVMLLNMLDERLTENGIDTKIVFIMYVDTLWPPITEKLNNPSRFILTTACGTGCGYSDKRREGGIPKWERNNFKVKGGLEMALSFVDAWKSVFDGPRFIYEYYLYTSHFSDPGYMSFSETLAKDVRKLHLTGFDGIMSDQTQRAFFPTGLPISILGESLFDTSFDIEGYIDKYFADAFGSDYPIAKEYLERISKSFDFKALTLNLDITAQDTGSVDENGKKAGIIGNLRAGDMIAAVPSIVDEYAPYVERNLKLDDECHRESWKILKFHGGYCKGLSKIYFALSREDIQGANAELDKLIDWLSEIEMEIHPYFDLVLFNQRTKQLIAGK